MRTSVAITIAVCSALYYAVTLVSGLEKRSYNIIDNESSLPLTGDDLRVLADKVDIYNALISHIESKFPEQFKRGGGGCSYFTGCAQLVIGQNALRNMMHRNRASVFKSPYGPGRRKRSVNDGDELQIPNDDYRILADDVELYNVILGQITTTNSNEFKRGKGCSGFGGCAQLDAGQNALQAMIHANRASLFGSAGPGKRRRSVDNVQQDNA